MPYANLSRIARLTGLTLLAGAALTSPALADGGGASATGGAGASAPSASAKRPAHPRRGHRVRTADASVGARVLGQRTLREGMKGRDVSQLQNLLTKAGFPTPVDGDFGPGTKSNVVAFEQSVSLPADGVVTPSVVQAMRQSVAQAAAADQSNPPVGQARLNPDGTVTAPSDAPAVIKQVIAAANKIAFTPYQYGGGHGSFNSSGYDCSGSVSYALHGGQLLSQPEDSSQLESFGLAGSGQWITIWSNSGHAYMEIAGLYFDTAGLSSRGDRWTTSPASPLSGFTVRHPANL